jgi:protein-arginine kinase activator protein McsA
MIPAPDADSPQRRIGELKWKQELAVVTEDYEEAAELQKEIDDLTVQLKQEVA